MTAFANQKSVKIRQFYEAGRYIEKPRQVEIVRKSIVFNGKMNVYNSRNALSCNQLQILIDLNARCDDTWNVRDGIDVRVSGNLLPCSPSKQWQLISYPQS